jgi:hypothetical protein
LFLGLSGKVGFFKPASAFKIVLRLPATAGPENVRALALFKQSLSFLSWSNLNTCERLTTIFYARNDTAAIPEAAH